MRTASKMHAAAAALDGLCLVAFVLAGRQSHGLDSGVGWFTAVIWPVVVGWFAVAIVVRLYTARARPLLRIATTIAAGVALGLVLRIAVTHRDTPVAFVLVSFAFIALTTVGWRLVAGLLPRALARGRR